MHKLYLFFGALVALLCTPLNPTHAANSEAGAGFTIGINAPDSEEKTYVQYQLKANEQKKIALTINNRQATTQKYEVTAVKAGTSSTGTTLYSPKMATVNIFQPQLPDMLTPKKQTVTVPAKQSKTVDYLIKSPADGISGDVLGALYVHKSLDAEKQKGIGVQNAFAMSMPIHLYGSDQKSIMPKLKLSDAKVTKTGGDTMVVTKLTNAAARFFGHITMKTQVVNAAGNNIANTTLEDIEMAPAAVMAHNIPVKADSLKAGKYTVKTKLTSGKKTYHLTDTFVVKASTVRELKTDTNQSTDRNWLIWLIAGLLAVTITLLVALIVVTRKKKGAAS